MRAAWLHGGLAVILLVFPPGAAGGQDPAGADDAAWSFSVAGGYDTYIHTYPLATEDTTETVAEVTLVAGLEGRSAPRAIHRWLLRPELSLGTELVRGRLDFDYRYRPDTTHTSFRLEGAGLGRAYRGGTDYTLSSDAVEGRTSARLYLAPRAATVGELRLFGNLLRYRDPSSLEVDHHEVGAGAFLRSSRRSSRHFVLGGRLARRTYPDSAAIDRVVATMEGEYDASGWQGRGLRVYHRTQRRTVRDPAARPDAWNHWSELEGVVPAGRFRLAMELQSEVWRYQPASSVFLDAWRLTGTVFLKGGGPLDPGWSLGLTAENFAAGDSPETYRQIGLRVGVETFGTTVAGSVSVEYGRRNYLQQEPEFSRNAASITDLSYEIYYSDFNYWELWLMGAVVLGTAINLEVMANYQPERHTERTDDSAVAFASLRVVWRP